MTRSKLATVVAIALLLVACGSTEQASDSTTGASGAPPATDDGATSQPAATDLVPATDSLPAAPATTSATEPGGEPAVTDATSGGWKLVENRQIPSLPGGKSAPIVDPLPDGVYWSWSYVSAGDSVDFTLSQIFTGDACTEQFGDSDVACASDNETLYDPSANVAMSAGTAAVTVVGYNPDGSFDAYSVSAAEFVRLVAGKAPSADAPVGFAFQNYFAVILTLRDGQVVAVDQVFMS